jgi:hypothetical protein
MSWFVYGHRLDGHGGMEDGSDMALLFLLHDNITGWENYLRWRCGSGLDFPATIIKETGLDVAPYDCMERYHDIDHDLGQWKG